MFVYVTTSCTSELQALDKSVNDPYKMELKQSFIGWCDVQKVLDKREEFHISLQTSIIKEVHTKWRIKTHSEIEKRRVTIKSGLK